MNGYTYYDCRRRRGVRAMRWAFFMFFLSAVMWAIVIFAGVN